MKIFVKPKEGLVIRRPDNGRVLSAEGEEVPQSTFWQRRINEGDVIEGKAPVAAAKKAPAPMAAKKDGGEK
jgi:hypothetical protein